MKQIKIGLAGNPNSGKTTIFNGLTGSHQKVGNYAGVTVEKKEGRRIHKDTEFIIFDLPGTYSLTAYSLDEVVARDFILDEKPDIIIDVIDSTNVERNLYLCLQFQELGIPVIGALNIIDQAEDRGIRIDDRQLSRILGIPMVKTVGPKEKGLEELLDLAIAMAGNAETECRYPSYGAELEAEITRLSTILGKDLEFISAYPVRWMAIKLLEKDKNAMEKTAGHRREEELHQTLTGCIRRIEVHFGRDSEIVISEQRYAYIHGTMAETVSMAGAKTTATERIDQVLLNRFTGMPIFLAVIWAIFQLTFTIGAFPHAWLDSLFGWLGGTISSALPDGLLKSLIVDGIIGGVGGVLSFVPQIVILFMFISILEDTGYMARAAFIMDKFLHIFGLHGQSFVPLMIGFGCSVPAMMACRSLKSTKDRIATVLVMPFMNCGAKLPVHILLAGAFFATNAGNVVLLIYLIGVALALVSSLIFRKTVLRGEATPFVMELPPYRLPTVTGILWHIWDKTTAYLKRAGVILFPASILIWALITFPQPPGDASAYLKQAETRRTEFTAAKIAEIVTALAANGKMHVNQDIINIEAGAAAGLKVKQYADVLRNEAQLSYSIAGRVGKLIEPAVKPIGFDWKIGVATVTGFAAKEVVVSTLGILYKTGGGGTDENGSLIRALRADPAFNPLVAFVLMLFILILAPCFAAQATIKAELGWKWLGFYLLYSFAVTWGLCFAVYQIGSLLGLGVRI